MEKVQQAYANTQVISQADLNKLYEKEHSLKSDIKQYKELVAQNNQELKELALSLQAAEETEKGAYLKGNW